MKPKPRQSQLKAGILGCGTIGSYLAGVLQKEFPREVGITHLCDHREENASALIKKLKLKARCTDLESLVKECDLVIEAASPRAVAALLKTAHAVRRYPDLVVMSTGGLVEAYGLARKYAGANQGRIYAPSGAVAGVDGVLAARESGLRSVLLKTRKPPAGLRDAPYFKTRRFPTLQKDKERCVFRGTASQAIKAFPQNINVSAVLSLAGFGPGKTRVEIWTSEKYSGNTHEIYLEYDGGKITVVCENQPSKNNPKTSALAMYSAVALLRKLFSQTRIGS